MIIVKVSFSLPLVFMIFYVYSHKRAGTCGKNVKCSKWTETPLLPPTPWHAEIGGSDSGVSNYTSSFPSLIWEGNLLHQWRRQLFNFTTHQCESVQGFSDFKSLGYNTTPLGCRSLDRIIFLWRCMVYSGSLLTTTCVHRTAVCTVSS